MANYVNVQKQEYAGLQAGLEAIHQKVLADMLDRFPIKYRRFCNHLQLWFPFH